MKLAFTTLACPSWSLEQAVDQALRSGYEGLELRLLDGELLRSNLDSVVRGRVRSVCAEAGIPIVCIDTSVRIAQPDPVEREAHIREGLAFLELAAEWDAPLIRVFGGPPAGIAEADALAAASACLAPLAERGRALGVAVALETHDAFSSSAAVAHVLGQVPGSGAGALWDTLHPYRVGEAIDETLSWLGDRLLHVHVKDGRRPYAGWLAVEWEKKWHPELAAPEVALPQHAAALRAYLADLGC